MTNKNIKQTEDMLLKLGGTYILNHAKRTLHLSKQIAMEENIEYDENILQFICYFHDISVFPPYRPEGKFDHALESSKLMPQLAKEYGFSDKDIEVIVEAVLYHDKPMLGKYNETKLLRDADGVDYLGCMAIARDFSKLPKDMKGAISAIEEHKESFSQIIETEYARRLAKPRIKEIDDFITSFKKESFGMY